MTHRARVALSLAVALISATAGLATPASTLAAVGLCSLASHDTEENKAFHFRPFSGFDQVLVALEVCVNGFLHVTVGRADHNIHVLERCIQRCWIH